jgi:hypothetical protein
MPLPSLSLSGRKSIRKEPLCVLYSKEVDFKGQSLFRQWATLNKGKLYIAGSVVHFVDVNKMLFISS